MVIGLRRFHLIKSMTESERKTVFKFSLNEQKLIKSAKYMMSACT